MSEKKDPITITKSHSDNDWSLETRRGVDIIDVNFKQEVFTHYRIEPLTLPGVSGYEVKSAPKKGSSGRQQFRIKWHHAPFNKVSYRLRAYSGKPTPIEIVMDAHNWLNEVKDAIEQGLEIRLVVRGVQARNLYRQLLVAAPNDLFVPSDLFFEQNEISVSADDSSASDPENGTTAAAPAAEAVTITVTLAICATLVIMAGFATIAGVLMLAIQKGYNVETGQFEVDTPLGKYKLGFKLTPPK